MKTLYLAIITSLIFLLTMHQVSADLLTPKTISELYKEYKLIIRGHVVTVSQNLQKNLTAYDVKIDEFLKLPQSYSVITVSSPNQTNRFNVGDNVQFYLDQRPAGYIVSPYSFRMDEGCTGFTSLTFLNYSAPAPASDEPGFFDLNGNSIETPSLDQNFRIGYNGVNDTPLNKTSVELSIKLNNDSTPIFHDRKLLSVQPCRGLVNTSWYFVPHQVGNYSVEVTQTSGLYDNKIIFGNATFNHTFSINQNKTTAILSTPLKQYHSGISALNVKCNTDLVLVTKSEDGSPACIRPDTAQKLVERGWAKRTTNTFEYRTRLNPVVDVVSIQLVSPPNPGGPKIQLTLMNIGMKPITNLNVTLDLNNNYVFNFKDVTESNPLVSGHSTSDTEILIGAGFTTGMTYPLTVVGTVNNETFSYTLNVHIPYTNLK